ncbi:MAG: hypothetical protein K6L60_08015 [Oceanobacter sp.]
MVVDKNGKEIKVGSRVRVLKIDQSLLDILPEDEADDVKSMLNEVLEVYEIDEYDCAWVEKWWSRGDGRSESHSLSLSSAEMELVP